MSNSSGPPWIVACQAPLYMGLYMYIQGIFLTQGSNLGSPALQSDLLLSERPGKLHLTWKRYLIRGCIYYYLLHLCQSRWHQSWTYWCSPVQGVIQNLLEGRPGIWILIWRFWYTKGWEQWCLGEVFLDLSLILLWRYQLLGRSWDATMSQRETLSPCARLVCSPESRRKIQVLPPTEQTLHCKLILLFRCLFSKGFS